jgi:hypothetical protein
MKALSIYISLACCLTSYSQQYVKLKYDENIDLLEQESFAIGFEYETRKGKTKQKGKYFNKTKYLNRFNLVVIGGKYYESNGKVFIDSRTTQNNNNEIIFTYNHPFEKKIKITDTIKLPSLIGLKIAKGFQDNLYRNFEYKINLEATFSNGKRKIITNDKIQAFLLKYNAQFELTGGNKKPLGYIAIKTKTKDSLNNFITINYTSKSASFIASQEIFKINKLVDIDISQTELSYNTLNKIVAIVSFENGNKREFSGEKLQKILKGYNISAFVKNGEIIDGYFSSFPFSEDNSGVGEIALNSDYIQKKYLFPLKLDKSFDYSFGAKKN